jgi:hypothetical protein
MIRDKRGATRGGPNSFSKRTMKGKKKLASRFRSSLVFHSKKLASPFKRPFAALETDSLTFFAPSDRDHG